MIEKLREIIKRRNELVHQMAAPDATADTKAYSILAKEQAELMEVAAKAEIYSQLHDQIEEDEALLKGDDDDLKQIAEEEIPGLKRQLAALEDELKILLVPRDPNDDKNTILEVRSGAGGEEAALFAGDLLRMYSRYAERKGWETEIMSLSEAEAGGIKEVIMAVRGRGVYGELKYESGVHRVQRVPATESSGRIHTSAATVAVLAEAAAVEVDLQDSDLKIDTYRASGAGGQHVNKTESAIRITHMPSGIVVTCQDEKSQHKNKAKAMKVLAARLYAVQVERQEKARAKQRRSMISTGDRSAKIRTYNYPQGRVTDHRINLTLHKLADITDGNLGELIEALRIQDRMDRLADV